MTAFVCTEEPGTDDFAVKLFKSNGMDMAVPAMLVMLDNLPKSKLKQLLLEKVLAAKFQLFQLPANDLRRLVRACQDEEDMAQLQQTFCQRWLLDSVPTEHKDLQDLVNTLEHFLAPFANTKISVPRLESLCAGRLMQWLAQAGTTKADEAFSHCARNISSISLVLIHVLMHVLVKIWVVWGIYNFLDKSCWLVPLQKHSPSSLRWSKQECSSEWKRWPPCLHWSSHWHQHWLQMRLVSGKIYSKGWKLHVPCRPAVTGFNTLNGTVTRCYRQFFRTSRRIEKQWL